MQNVERLSITLPAEMARLIRSKVEQGRYASNSEVIREAMRAWLEREQLRERRLDAIRAKVDEADNDPRSSLSAEEVRRHFERRFRDTAGATQDDG